MRFEIFYYSIPFMLEGDLRLKILPYFQTFVECSRTWENPTKLFISLSYFFLSASGGIGALYYLI
jgi:hypothetical protein